MTALCKIKFVKKNKCWFRKGFSLGRSTASIRWLSWGDETLQAEKRTKYSEFVPAEFNRNQISLSYFTVWLGLDGRDANKIWKTQVKQQPLPTKKRANPPGHWAWHILAHPLASLLWALVDPQLLCLLLELFLVSLSYRLDTCSTPGDRRLFLQQIALSLEAGSYWFLRIFSTLFSGVPITAFLLITSNHWPR